MLPAVALERWSYRRIDGAGLVVGERIKTDGRVATARGVARERIETSGRVVDTFGVLIERTRTSGRVPGADVLASSA